MNLNRGLFWVVKSEDRLVKATNFLAGSDESKCCIQFGPTGRWAAVNPNFSEPLVVAFLDALETSSNPIEHVTINSAFIQWINTTNPEIVSRFLRVVGELPNLQSVIWIFTDQPGPRTCMQHLTRLLMNTHRLEVFDCQFVDFCGTQQDFQEFANVFCGHSCMRTVRFYKCTINSQTQVQISDCKVPVLRALQSIPNLFYISPSGWATQGNSGSTTAAQDQSTSALADLLLHPTLSCICLCDNPLSSFSEPVSLAIQANQALKCLKIKVSSEETECRLLADIVSENKSIKELVLHEGSLATENDQYFEYVLGAFEKNKKIQAIVFAGGYVPSPKIRSAMITMVEHNTTLERVEILPTRIALQTDISRFQSQLNFYLKLNGLGRKRILGRERSANIWIEVLSHVSLEGDLSSLFYFLSLNPALCGHQDKARGVMS